VRTIRRPFDKGHHWLKLLLDRETVNGVNMAYNLKAANQANRWTRQAYKSPKEPQADAQRRTETQRDAACKHYKPQTKTATQNNKTKK